MAQAISFSKKTHKDLRGGKGYVTERNCTVNLFGRCWQFIMLTLDPKASIGMHKHVVDSEIYFALSRFIKFCVSNKWNLINHCKKGDSHCAYNTGNKKARIFAIKY